MKIEDRIGDYYERTVTSAEPVPIDDVMRRGGTMRKRARIGTTILTTLGIALIALVGVALLDFRVGSEAARSEQLTSLSGELADSWTPVPDPVDPDLAAIAETLCPVNELAGAPGGNSPYVSRPSVLVIDQRGISAVISRGAETTSGWRGFSCGAVKVGGVWTSGDQVSVAGPPMVVTMGEAVSDLVTEMRFRFPDGTEVTASLDNGHYIARYPVSLDETITGPSEYSYIDSYVDDTLVHTEIHMSYEDVLNSRRRSDG